MIRLFLKVYGLVILALITANLIFGLLSVNLNQSSFEQSVRSRISGVSYLLAERFNSLGRVEAIQMAQSLQPHFSYGLKVVDRSLVSPVAEQLDALHKQGFFIHLKQTNGKLSEVKVYLSTGGDYFLEQDLTAIIESRDMAGLLFPIVVWGTTLAMVLLLTIYPFYQRLRRLSRVAKRVSDGDFEVEISDEKGKETEVLATTLKRLVKRIKHLLANQQQFLRIVAHEFRTPLTRIQFLLEELRAPQTEALVVQIEEEIGEVNDILAEMGRYIQLTKDPVSGVLFERFSLKEQANVLLDKVTLPWPQISVKLEVKGNDQVVQDKRLLAYVFQNLLSNALKWADEQVQVTIICHQNSIELEVKDDGPGVAEGKLAQIFDPFYKDAVKGGMGLGLAIVKRIVEELLKGQIHAKNGGENGLLVYCKIPVGSAGRVSG